MDRDINEVLNKIVTALRKELPLASISAIANSTVLNIDVYVFQQNSVSDGNHLPLCAWSVTPSLLLNATKDLFLKDIPAKQRSDLDTFYLCAFIDGEIAGINFVDSADAIRFVSGLPATSAF